MPKVEVQVSVDAPGFDGRGGFVTTGDRAWFTRGNVGYAVPQAAWSKIVKARAEGTPPDEEGAEADVNPSTWLQNVKSEGTEQMDGVQVTHVSADVNSAAAIADVVKAMDTATGASRPAPSSASPRSSRPATSTHGSATTRSSAASRSRCPARATAAGSVDVNLDVRLSQVNKPQDIAAPAKVKKGLPGGVFGQFATGVVGGLGSTVGVTPERSASSACRQTNSHKKAERAVADHKKVVILFQNPRALDDQAVADSVRSLDRRTKNVVVLTDDVRNVDRYGKLLEDLGVNQAPAIVIIGRSGKAQLDRGLHRRPLARPGSRGRAMSDEGGCGRAVARRARGRRGSLVPSNGLTPPHKKKAGSRFISDVIVEMGFLARERVDGRRRGGQGLGPLAGAGAARGAARSRATSSRARWRSASASTTST